MGVCSQPIEKIVKKIMINLSSPQLYATDLITKILSILKSSIRFNNNKKNIIRKEEAKLQEVFEPK